MSIKTIILKANILLALTCMFWFTGLYISKSACSQILESRVIEDMIVLYSKENKRLQVNSYTNYHLARELDNHIASHNYLAVYISGHGTGKTISFSDLKNPFTLLQVVLILLISLIVLIYYHLFKILLALIFILAAIEISLLLIREFVILLFQRFLNI